MYGVFALMSQVTIAQKNSVITQEEHLSIRGTKPRLAGTKKGWISPYYSCYLSSGYISAVMSLLTANAD